LQKFIARQPIFNADRSIYGYEILFRSSMANFFDGSNLDGAAASTADNMFLFGLERLTQGHRAFLNCTRDFLVRDYPVLLPKDRVVIEVLETVKVDAEVLAACLRLKKAGYLLALDDFQDSPQLRELVAMADIIKVDILATSREEQIRLARAHSKSPIRLLAEKVETYEDFQRTLGWGYTYFQGYFFSRPEILTRHDIPAYKLNYLRVLQAVNQSPMNMQHVSNRIKEEASLSYRLLRYLNSPAFFLAVEVHSIPHALSLLGERGVRRWVSLVVVACMGEDKPEELVMLPLMRARFCELLAPPAGLADASNDLFLLGLLSAMDAILDMKMEDVLREVAIRDEIRDALLGKQNPFRQLYDVALHYELGEWDNVEQAAALLKINVDAIPALFLQAMDWARGVLSGQQVNETAAT
jgi:c-di-GMP-related signal transduction protein